MLGFVVPLVHPDACDSYERISQLLEQTLISICAQSDTNFRVTVVCSEVPDISFSHEKVDFLNVDFPAPDTTHSFDDNSKSLYLDKGCRVLKGLLHIKKHKPDHVMFVDADDFISCRLAEYANKNLQTNGWFFPNGYVYSLHTKLLKERSMFWSYCGSSHIIKADLFEIPNEIPNNASKDEIISLMDYYYLNRILGNHTDYIKYFMKKGNPLSPLPFPGAVYVADTGENSYRRTMKDKRWGPVWGQKTTHELNSEFGIPVTQRSISDEASLYALRARNIVGRTVRMYSSGKWK